MTKTLVVIVLLYCSERLQIVDSQLVDPVVISAGDTGSCASLEERQATIESLRNDVRTNTVFVSVT